MTDEQLVSAPRKRPRRPKLELVTPEQKLEAAAPQRKIAVLGSAVSSIGLAPVNDPEWEIWGCSPANKPLPRVDFWFELHNWELKRREGLTEWLEYLKTKPRVFVQGGNGSDPFPGAIVFPLDQMIRKFGPFWWTSQISYMLALAIEQKPEAIGLYGVDMAANSEYNQQRLACQFFIKYILENTDIKLVVPPESDILEPAPLYGYCESSRRWRKYNARNLELGARIANCDHEVEEMKQERIQIAGYLNPDLKKFTVEHLNKRAAELDRFIPNKLHERIHLRGAQDDMEYQLAHWANTRDFY